MLFYSTKKENDVTRALVSTSPNCLTRNTLIENLYREMEILPKLDINKVILEELKQLMIDNHFNILFECDNSLYKLAYNVFSLDHDDYTLEDYCKYVYNSTFNVLSSCLCSYWDEETEGYTNIQIDSKVGIYCRCCGLTVGKPFKNISEFSEIVEYWNILTMGIYNKRNNRDNLIK